ncbi:MAG: histidine kinase dimerization/phosphoacceptor domain -containing protein [Sediminispirochaetaceae bacterium]
MKETVREKRILLAEADKALAREISDALKRHGYGVLSADTAEEVLKAAINLFDTQQGLADSSRDGYELLLGSTLGAVDSLLVVIDRNYRIVLSNWKNHEWVPLDKRESLPFCYDVMKNRSTPCPNCPIERVFSKKETVWYDDKNPLDGSCKEISAIPILNRRGEVQYMLENVRDVTERVQTEQHLKRKTEEQSMLLETMDAQVWYLNDAETYGTANRAHVEFLGLRKEDVEHRKLTDFLKEDVAKICIEGNRLVFENKKSVKTTEWIPDVTGEYRLIAITKTPKVNDDGEVDYVICVGTDITDMKRKEDQLISLNAQKDYLMREIHHRVKNNLMMVTSLVHLKDTALGREVDLSDVIHQIDAIRIVHEKLYRTEALNSINISEYIQDLLSTVFTLSAKPIQIDIQIADRDLNTRIAVPLGLIVNEIATNAIKHGFDPGIENHFAASLIEDANAGEFVLVLSNTGPAFPSEVDLDNPDSLGLQLVQTLVKEIGGTMELQRQPSPEFTIRFPMKDI